MKRRRKPPMSAPSRLTSTPSERFRRRARIYAWACSLGVLGAIFCIGIFATGQRSPHALGWRYLESLPNYWVFYCCILPFLAAGVIYLAFVDRFARFTRHPLDPLDEDLRRRVCWRQRALIGICLPFCFLIAIEDAAEKHFTLPPYAYHFADARNEQAVTEFYACAKKWADCSATASEYLAVLQRNGVDTTTATGWTSLSQWWKGASWLYIFESVLSFLAAVVVCTFAVQVIVLVMLKSLARPETQNLIMYVTMLISLWFPTAMYSFWNRGLFRPEGMPAVVMFGSLCLLLGALLVLFIRTKHNDLAAYGTTATAMLSASVVAIGLIKPDVVPAVSRAMHTLGVAFGLMLITFLAAGLFAVTEHFLGIYDDDGTPAV
jgi:hypothetical protein